MTPREHQSLLRTGAKWMGGILVLLAVAHLTAWAARVPEPGPLEQVPLELMEKRLIEEKPGERLYSLQFHDPAGNPVDAYLRMPARGDGEGEEVENGERAAAEGGDGYPAVVLVAGRFAGREAAALIPGPLNTMLLAVEYPQTIPLQMSAWEWMRALPAIRRSARAMPGVLSGAARYLAAHPEVDSSRIVLVGVSFGVPFAAAAGRDRIFQGVALHYGGANLGSLFRANLPVENALIRGALSGFAGWWFRELDPARHVGQISPTPLLLINATEDDQIPRESALLLARRAREPLHHIWLPYGHLNSGEREVMREVADSTFRHFGFQPN